MTSLLKYVIHHQKWKTLVFRMSHSNVLISRHLSEASNVQTEVKTRFDYTLIYRFRYIATAYAFNKVKLYLTLTSITFLPLGIILRMSSISDTVLELGIFAFITGALFHAMGYFCNNLIGLVGVAKDSSNIKLSYLSTWGKRIDIYTDVLDICDPVDDSNCGINSLYYCVRFHSTKKVLKLYVSHGQIIDKQKLKNIFGTIC